MRKAWYAVLTGFIMSVLLFGSQYVSAEETKPVVSAYTTDDGIDIISYADSWNESMLADVGAELQNNVHGIEMEYLDRIEIHPGIEPGGDEDVSASYRRETQSITIPVNLTGFLPDDYELSVSVNKGVIGIYQADNKAGIEDIALDLSHEYGHHFTFFHFGGSFSDPDGFKKSEYYRIRQLKDYKEVNGESSYVDNIHKWSIYEIAAEDYKQLMGSNTGKQPVRFQDISQKTGQPTYQPVNQADSKNYNALPQENWDIPLASQIKGLKEYFSSFVDEDPVSDNNFNASDLPDLSYREETSNGFRKGIIEWHPIDNVDVDNENAEKGNVIYTLIAFTEDDKLVPVKTVFPGEETSAVIGTVTEIKDQYIYYYQDELDKGKVRFILYIQLPDGQITASEPLTVDFGPAGSHDSGTGNADPDYQ